MAKAPRPGRTPSAKPQRTAIRITVDGDTHVLNLDDLGPQDDLISRRETGFPVTAFVDDDRFGTDSLAVLWWTARRKNGEAGLRFRDVVDSMPGHVDLGAMFAAGRISMEAIEDDVVDVEEIGAGDPLRSGGA